MKWRCVAKKADGTKCKCAVAKRGGKCSHHKRKKNNPRKKAKRRPKKKAHRKRKVQKRRCKRILSSGRRCACYCAGKRVFCSAHKSKRKKAKRKRNPIAPFSQLEDRWSLPRLPKGTIR